VRRKREAAEELKKRREEQDRLRLVETQRMSDGLAALNDPSAGLNPIHLSQN
jgi:hypothetical protein